jgi:phage terminase large subunit
LYTPELLVDKKTGEPLIDLYEGSTYENKDNLEPDFIETLEQTYKGQMRDRFLLGNWGAYEGLVYPAYDPLVHEVDAAQVTRYIEAIEGLGYNINWVEGYDYGMAVPACYLLAAVDDDANVIIVDGFYERERTVEWQAERITAIRDAHGYVGGNIFADPQVFRRSGSDRRTVGKSTASLFRDCGIQMQRGNNDIANGIQKVQSYLSLNRMHHHPIFNTYNAPRFYCSNNLPFVGNEFSEYYWKRDTGGEVTDKPVDRNDHAMDTIKYLLSEQPELAHIIVRTHLMPEWTQWHEYEREENRIKARHKV